MKISINNNDYILKYTLRALFIFERIAETQFTGTKLMDYYLLFYCILLANNDTFNMTFDELIEVCDNEPSLFKEFMIFLNKEFEIQNQLVNHTTEPIDSKKKV